MFLNELKRNTTSAAQRLLFGAVCPCCEPALVPQLHRLGAVLAWGVRSVPQPRSLQKCPRAAGQAGVRAAAVQSQQRSYSRGRVYFHSHIMQIPGRGARRFQVSALRVDTNCWCRDQGSGFAKITGRLKVNIPSW